MSSNIKPATSCWRELASRVIKSEMAKKGIKYSDLSDRLERLDTLQSADNLRNKINKGILGADLFLQIMLVLNVTKIERENLVEILKEVGVAESELQ
ncbi:DUF6471 domain-containing protein [Alkalimarinus alittae]|uniref:DUF6471 domain-containing protein n=1 Tax=Alkalimarinus alittae TaxID=2961619 RepID=A0ABY6N5G0_9ALTE|nr:DUF6471 domain-containing protein [Alkalimarinus alittae]UZE97353.1 DUF6471 domain-containing protein [Alkalimarinus alittae]